MFSLLWLPPPPVRSILAPGAYPRPILDLRINACTEFLVGVGDQLSFCWTADRTSTCLAEVHTTDDDNLRLSKRGKRGQLRLYCRILVLCSREWMGDQKHTSMRPLYNKGYFRLFSDIFGSFRIPSKKTFFDN